MVSEGIVQKIAFTRKDDGEQGRVRAKNNSGNRARTTPPGGRGTDVQVKREIIHKKEGRQDRERVCQKKKVMMQGEGITAGKEEDVLK